MDEALLLWVRWDWIFQRGKEQVDPIQGGGAHYEAILGFFANSQDCSQSTVLGSLFSADLASPNCWKRRFYIFDFIRRYIWSKI